MNIKGKLGASTIRYVRDADLHSAIEAYRQENPLSWNDLADRPFEETVSDTLTWDGDTTWLVSVEDTFFKVSDALPSKSILPGSTVTTEENGELHSYTVEESHLIVPVENLVLCMATNETQFCIVYAPCVYSGVTFNVPGIYFLDMSVFGREGHTSSLTIPDYEFTEVKRLGAKYTPKNVPWKYVVVCSPDSGGVEPEFDKTFAEIAEAYHSGATVTLDVSTWNLGFNEMDISTVTDDAISFAHVYWDYENIGLRILSYKINTAGTVVQAGRLIPLEES